MHEQHRAQRTGAPPVASASAGTVPPTAVPPTAVPPTAVPPTAPAPAARTGGSTALDVRAAARASLAAGRSPSLWWVCTGVVLTVVVSWVVGAAEGALLLAALLSGSAVARAALRRGPVALTVRSRVMDTAVLLGLALGVGALSQLIPTR